MNMFHMDSSKSHAHTPKKEQKSEGKEKHCTYRTYTNRNEWLCHYYICCLWKTKIKRRRKKYTKYSHEQQQNGKIIINEGDVLWFSKRIPCRYTDDCDCRNVCFFCSISSWLAVLVQRSQSVQCAIVLECAAAVSVIGDGQKSRLNECIDMNGGDTRCQILMDWLADWPDQVGQTTERCTKSSSTPKIMTCSFQTS